MKIEGLLLLLSASLRSVIGFQPLLSYTVEPPHKTRSYKIPRRNFFAGRQIDQQGPLLLLRETNNSDKYRVLGEDGEEEDSLLLDEETMSEIEESQPSQWMVMKDLLGINIFTYILAAAIAFFLGMNTMLGPGWLGNSIGVQNTGTFTETSQSLPEAIDLSNSDFRI